MNTFRLLMPHEVIHEWDRLSHLLSFAVEQSRGECCVSDIRQLVLSGRMFVFADDQFAVTCEFTTYPQKTIMVVGFGAGEVCDRAHIGNTLRDFAKAGGASSIQTYCKNPAMIRYYRRWFHLEPVYTVLETEL